MACINANIPFDGLCISQGNQAIEREVKREGKGGRGIGDRGEREALEKLQTGRFNVLTWPRGHWRPAVALHAAARVAQLYTMSQFESETEKKVLYVSTFD